MRIRDWSSDVCSSDLDGVVAEAAGEGFRQQHQVGVAVQRCDQVAVVVAVAGGVVPAGGALYERDAEVLHGGCPGNSCGSGLRRELFVRLSATLPPKARGSRRSHEHRGVLAYAAYSICRRPNAA